MSAVVPGIGVARAATCNTCQAEAERAHAAAEQAAKATTFARN